MYNASKKVMKKTVSILLVLITCLLSFTAIRTTPISAATTQEGFDKPIIGARGWALYSITATTTSGSVTLKPGDGFIILSVTSNNKWSVAYKDKTVTVDPAACLINMPDIFNDMSKVDPDKKSINNGMYFNITNNSANIYTYLTKDLNVAKLLPDQRLYDWNTQFVPIYYKTAIKIGKAKSYLSKNYPNTRFKFYDTFRPNGVSTKLSNVFNKVVPGGEWDSTLPQTKPLYKRWLLAYAPSYHNVGLAVDVTLCDLNGNEFGTEDAPATYSPMHALYGKAVSSWSLSQGVKEYNSAVGNCTGKISYKVSNNKTVTEIMRESYSYGNMGTLASEWWHFQDNESSKNTTFGNGTGFSTRNNSTVANKTPKTLVNPGSIVSASVTNNGYLIKWDDLNVPGYRIFRKVDGGEWIRIATISGATTSYLDKENKSPIGSTCYYTVRCIDENDNYISDFQSSNPIAIGVPIMISAKLNGCSVNVKWSAIKGATGYRLYVKKNGSSWIRLPDTTKAEGEYKLSEDDKSGDNFVFTARSYNDSGDLSSFQTEEQSKACITLNSLSTLCGDANGDGVVDVLDTVVIKRVLAEINTAKSTWYNIAADVTSDGEVDSIDATFIARYISLINTPYPIGTTIYI